MKLALQQEQKASFLYLFISGTMILVFILLGLQWRGYLADFRQSASAEPVKDAEQMKELQQILDELKTELARTKSQIGNQLSTTEINPVVNE